MKRSLLSLGLSIFLIVPAFSGQAMAKPLMGETNRPEEGQNSVGKKDLPSQAKSVRLEGQGNTLHVQPLDDEGEDLKFSDGDEVDSFVLEGEEGDEDGETEVEVKSQDNAAVVIRNKLATQTHFPLTVNLETNELIVTTPKGEKVVTVLPDQAVANMLAAKVLDQVGGKGGIRWLEQQVATPSSTPVATPSAEPSASPSAEPAGEEAAVVLTVNDDGELVYEISGIKLERLLGLIPVGLRRKVIVSAETGELIRVNQSIFTRLLDLLSV